MISSRRAWLFRVFGKEALLAPEQCVHFDAFRYGTDYYNPYQSFIEVVHRGESQQSARDGFIDFLRYYRPKHFGEAIGVQLDRRYPLWNFPWGRRKGSGGWCPNPQDCPDILTHFALAGIARWKIEQEFAWLGESLASIKKYGYQPKKFRSIILARRLEPIVGDPIYLLLDGNHRIAVLGVLGLKDIPVRYLAFRVVREDELCRWPYVRNGIYSEKDARRVFHAYFESNRAYKTVDTPAPILPL